MVLHPAGFADPGYCLRPYPNRRFEHARGTKTSWRVRKDFRAAFGTNSDYSHHCPRLSVRLHFVLRKILAGLMRESQQSDNVTRFQYRQGSQRYEQSPRAIMTDSFAEIDERPAKPRFRSSQVALRWLRATARPVRLQAID